MPQPLPGRVLVRSPRSSTRPTAAGSSRSARRSRGSTGNPSRISTRVAGRRFTAATCSPAAYRGNAFVCEPLTNLVHRRVLDPAGPTFVARRVDRIASSWPRPTRPSAPSTWHRARRRSLRGRLLPRDGRAPAVRPETCGNPSTSAAGRTGNGLADHAGRWAKGTGDPPARAMTSRELVALLVHPNGWVRDTAQRSLVERRDVSAAPALIDAATRTVVPSPGSTPWRTSSTASACSTTASAPVPLRDADPGVREAGRGSRRADRV